MAKEALIYGAGMSGLVCAINLAREGFHVTLIEREKTYGGDPLYNPSTHTTPINVKMTSDYIGIDVSPCFYPVIACPYYFHDTRAYAPHGGLFSVERGNRPTSLDTYLYGIAAAEGVRFEFGHALKKQDIGKLKPGTIIACGLTEGVYDMLNIPYRRWYGYISRGEIGFSNYSWLWWDEGITEYGYLSTANNYYFNLLFSNREVSRASLDRYTDFMRRIEGLEHEEWHYASGAVPLAGTDNLRLVRDGLIFCGTISGAMDPIGWFGILGALITGKVAAMALYDRNSAEAEFARFTKYFARALWIKNNIWYRIRPHVGLIENTLNFIGVRNIERLAAYLVKEDRHIPFSIPGFAHLGCY